MDKHVFERDLQFLRDAEVSAVGGDVECQKFCEVRCLYMVQNGTRWQWVIQGETVQYRQGVVRHLCKSGKWATARRFALCGRGDVAVLEKEGSGAKVRPKGCGCRFCPRCSRRYGRRYLSRVCGHLAARSHGEVWHFVLTQRVFPGASLSDTKDRFGVAWGRFYVRLRRMGLRSALATYHVKRSRTGGWHYHCHVIVEWEDGCGGDGAAEGIDRAWSEAKCEEGVGTSVFARKVCGEGAAMEGLAQDTQMEFWEESRSAVEVALQYCLRDVLQGVESWVEEAKESGLSAEFAGALEHAKLHRLYGEWRKALPAEVCEEGEAEEAALDAAVAKGRGKAGDSWWVELGTVDVVIYGAEFEGCGESREFLRRLLCRSSNSGVVTSRLKRVSRCIAA